MFSLSYIKKNPDIWGPFWITTTLIIILAMCSNFGGFFNWWQAYRELNGGGFFNSTGSHFKPDPNRKLVDWVKII